MHKYLIVDGMTGGTGIKNKYEGGSIELAELNLSNDILKKLKKWLKLYEYEHYNGYENIEKLNHLDDEGIEIAKMIKRELGDVKIEYFSDAKMISTML